MLGCGLTGRRGRLARRGDRTLCLTSWICRWWVFTFGGEEGFVVGGVMLNEGVGGGLEVEDEDR